MRHFLKYPHLKSYVSNSKIVVSSNSSNIVAIVVAVAVVVPRVVTSNIVAIIVAVAVVVPVAVVLVVTVV